MKNKSLFNKTLLYVGVIFIIVTSILFVLGSINREGYLSNLSINVDNTLKLNNIDLENTKKLFSLDDKLDYVSLTNYIFTNSNISKYSYNFRISYYSKVFGNSDIYGVYLNTNSLPDYIYDVKFQEKGSPFGVLDSSTIIQDEKINNVEYSLKIKYSFFIIEIILIFLCSILFYNFSFIIIDLSTLIYNFKLLKKISLKNKYLYILVIFLCFLIMPNIIYKIFYDKFDHINYENRNFAEYPKFDVKELDKYPELYETYFNDKIPFRNELVKLKSLIDIVIFNNSIRKDRIIGKDKWIFANWNMNDMYIGKEYTYFNDKELDEAKNNLLHFRNELKKRNIDFIFMICNDKQFIYDNYMPDYIRKTNITPTDQFVEYIRKETDIEIIYTKDELMKYKNYYQLYYKYDSHWNYLGSYIAYTQILEKMSNNYIPIDEVDFKDISLNGKILDVNTDQYNDLSKAFALSKTKFYNDDKRYIISGYSFDNYDKINVVDWANFTTISKKPLNNIYLFMLRDSYGSAIVPYISTSFNMVTYAHFRNFKITDLKNISPNLFIFEIVERRLKDYVLKTIPNYKIEEINKELKTNFIAINN